MMRAIFVILFCCVATIAYGYVTPTHVLKYADHETVVKQKKLFEIVRHLPQHEIHTELADIAHNWNIADHYVNYTNVAAVKNFVEIYEHGVLPFDEVFSVVDHLHLEQVVALFHVFYYAVDWDTFYQSVVWARFHINESMFAYALTVALIHRTDTRGLELPAPYEMYPYHFFNTEVIQQAHHYKMEGFHGVKKIEGIYNVVVPVNYTGWYLHVNPEQKVSYFTEDIGLNTYYYYQHIDYPHWLGGPEFGLYKDRRGEMYLYRHQQYLARYYMERLSNDLGTIPEFSWYHPIATGYYSSLSYYSGVHFPVRNDDYIVYKPHHYHDIYQLDRWEQRIVDAIDLGRAVHFDGRIVNLTKPESIEYVGNMVQGNPDSINPHYYGAYELVAKVLLGGSIEHFEEHKVIPGVLSHYETAMRDPMFYQLFKRIVKRYWQFKNILPSYTREELSFSGVKIQSVEVSKLVTYYDVFDVDISNSVGVHVPEVQDFIIRARTVRLNHLPFSYKIVVNAKVPVKGVVRVYIAPKYDVYGNVYGINENRENFFLLDVFPLDFVAGENLVNRESTQFSYWVKDRTTISELYRWVLQAEKGERQFPTDMTEAHCGMPGRLMLPKGKKGGMPFQFFFIVSPFHAPKVEHFSTYDARISCGIGSGSRFMDSLPLGYPFDRRISEKFWFTDNMHYYDTNIFHKKEADVNSVVV